MSEEYQVGVRSELHLCWGGDNSGQEWISGKRRRYLGGFHCSYSSEHLPYIMEERYKTKYNILVSIEGKQMRNAFRESLELLTRVLS
jgi:hypothetical protein